MSFCITNVKYNPLGGRAKIISMLSLLNIVCEMLIFVASTKSGSQFQVDYIMQDTEMLESITQSQYLVLTPLRYSPHDALQHGGDYVSGDD